MPQRAKLWSREGAERLQESRLIKLLIQIPFSHDAGELCGGGYLLLHLPPDGV
jgi:hypothetical protein